MSSPINVYWVENQHRWQANITKDSVRKCLTSYEKGEQGRINCLKKAKEFLASSNHQSNTLTDILDIYVNQVELVRSKTEFTHIKSAVKVWLKPFLGNLSPDDMDDGKFQFMLDRAAALGRSRKTIMDIRGITMQFFRWCRKNGYIYYYPEDVTIPKNSRYKGKNILTISDFEKLMTLSCSGIGNDEEDKYIHAFRFQVLTGIRPGELWGLSRKDFIKDKGCIHIHRAINRYKETTRGKNENAIRKVPLSEYALYELNAQLEIIKDSGDDANIFRITSQNNYAYHWRKYCEYNKIAYVTLYELRHTFVSICDSVNTGELKSLIGHSRSMDTYGVYQHELTNHDSVVSNTLNSIFESLLSKTV